MAVTNNLTEIDDCDQTTDWAAFNISGTLGGLSVATATSEDPAVPVEGTGCLGFDCDKESGGYLHTLPSTTDYSTTHLYIWLNIATVSGLEVANPGSGQSGIFLAAEDSSGNRGYWHVGGSDTYKGGWKCFVAYLGNTPDTNNGTNPTMTSCDKLGFGIDHPNAKSKATMNIFFDFMQVGNDGITVTGGSSGSPLDWDHVYTQDEASAMGVVDRVGGVYYLNGPVTWEDCYFADTNQVIIFNDVPVSSTLFQLNVEETSAAATCDFTLGQKSGTQGISGCVIKAAGTAKYTIDAASAAPTYLGLYGCTIIDANSVTLPANAAGREVLNCGFSECGGVDVDSCVVKYCNFINSDDDGVLMDVESHNFSDNNLIACPIGIEFSSNGTYALSNVVFSGCTTDIRNSAQDSNPTVTVNASGTSNPSDYEETDPSVQTTTINNYKNHILTGIESGSEVTYISVADPSVELYHVEDVDSTGSTTYQYNWTEDFDVDILIMHLSYEPEQIEGVTLTANDATLPVSQTLDRVYSNP